MHVTINEGEVWGSLSAKTRDYEVINGIHIRLRNLPLALAVIMENHMDKRIEDEVD